MTKTMKKITGLFLAVVLTTFTWLPVASAVSYPQNVTNESAYEAIEKTDSLIYSLLKSTQNKTLKQLVTKELYSDETLSALLVGVYSMLSQNEKDLSAMNIDISVKTVAKGLSQYPDVASELSAYNSWAEVKKPEASWGIKDKDGFCRGVAAILSPFNDILYTLLCSGSFSLNSIVGVKGGDGYADAIVPAMKSFGMKAVTDSGVFCSDAKKDKSNMVYHLSCDITAFLEDILLAPADRLTEILPKAAYFMNNGGFDKAVEKLIEPLTLQLVNITTFIKIKGLLNFIADPSATTQKIDINTLLNSGDLKVAEINLQEFASCVTVQGDTVNPDKGACFVVLLRFLIDTVKLNKDKTAELFENADKQSAELLKNASKLFEKETDGLVETYISLLTQKSGTVNSVQWTFSEFSPVTVEYTQNLGQEKFQRVLDGIDALIDEFVAEGGKEKTLKEMLSKEVFSSATITKLVSGVYSALTSKELKDLCALAGLDITPSQLASELSGAAYYSARNALYNCSSWKTVESKNIYWGFRAGDAKGFAKALSDCLAPFESVVSMLLAEGKVTVAGVDFYGSDGYNTAVIPLFEALGFKSETVPTYSEYKKQAEKGKGIEVLVNSVCAFAERFMEKPVYTITDILPNLLYFVENDGIYHCVKNLLYPLTRITDKLGINDIVDLSSLKNIEINKLAKELMSKADMGITLPEADIESLGKIGNLVETQSKRTSGGNFVKISYVEADRTALLVTILRYVVEVIKTPGNESIMNSFMGGGAEGGNEMFATYSAGIGEEMAAMTTDETVEWLYKLFFRERAVVPEKPEDNYLPTIIYVEEKESPAGKIFAIVAIALCVGEIFFLKKTGRIERFLEDRKIKKKLREEYDKKGEQEA